MFYFEVIDCGRRILLTGALVFIQPNTPEQAAIACMFAFASLLGFELLRPHLDPADSWIYRLVSAVAINPLGAGWRVVSYKGVWREEFLQMRE